MKKPRRNHSAQFKARVASAAVAANNPVTALRATPVSSLLAVSFFACTPATSAHNFAFTNEQEQRRHGEGGPRRVCSPLRIHPLRPVLPKDRSFGTRAPE